MGAGCKALIGLLRCDNVTAIGKAFVPAVFVKVVLKHFRALFEAINSTVAVVALRGKAGIAAILPAQLVFRRAVRRGKPCGNGPAAAKGCASKKKDKAVFEVTLHTGTIPCFSQNWYEVIMTGNRPCPLAGAAGRGSFTCTLS